MLNAQLIFDLSPEVLEEDIARLKEKGEAMVIEHIAKCHNQIMAMHHELQHDQLTFRELRAAIDERQEALVAAEKKLADLPADMTSACSSCGHPAGSCGGDYTDTANPPERDED